MSYCAWQEHQIPWVWWGLLCCLHLLVYCTWAFLMGLAAHGPICGSCSHWFMALAIGHLGTFMQSAQHWRFDPFLVPVGLPEKERFPSASWPNRNQFLTSSSFCSKMPLIRPIFQKLFAASLAVRWELRSWTLYLDGWQSCFWFTLFIKTIKNQVVLIECNLIFSYFLIPSHMLLLECPPHFIWPLVNM